LQARIRARSGDGAGAFAALGEVPQETRADDALVDVRARVAEVEAHLSTLPADPRRAARTAVSAVRRARGASLSEGEAEAREALQKALAARRRAEIGIRPTRDYAMAEDRSSDALWDFLACAARGEVPDVVLSLARLVLRQTGAERVFVAQVDSGGRVVAAHGVDLDGLALAEAAQRIDPAALRAALRGAGPVHHRDVATAGGRGSRLSVAGPEGPLGRSVVIAEHRFRPGCFDRITAAEAERWAILGALSLRLGAEVQESPKETKTPHTSSESFSPKSHADPPGATTVVPVSGPRRSFPGILGHSAALTRALARLSAALDSDLPVLIVGETGAGKEMFARALSDLGPRARRPFVAMNCGGVPDALFEAELFGHARGAFTGAERARAGLLSSAEGGTLLLDEIGELSPARQAALLRALETRRYRQVGSDEERAFDVRIVAATNRDLEKAVAERGFRQDLYYRLNAITLRVPPLRERAEDVPVLCRAFLERAGSRAQIAEDALEALAAYPWPGNVRELKNVMERLGALSVSRIERAHLPRAIRAGGVETREEDERAKVQRALAETGGNISRAAELLGLSRQGLKKRMVRLGLREPPPSSRRKVS
jgi:MoxR-like ATPase